jgi:hypothetical protein
MAWSRQLTTLALLVGLIYRERRVFTNISPARLLLFLSYGITVLLLALS